MIIIFFYNCRLTDNAELLRSRLKSLEDSRDQLEDSLRTQVSYNRSLEREMHKLKPDLMSLTRMQDRCSVYVFIYSFFYIIYYY